MRLWDRLKTVWKRDVMKLGDSGKNMNVQTVPTGSLSLDIALGLVVFRGDESLRSTDGVQW